MTLLKKLTKTNTKTKTMTMTKTMTITFVSDGQTSELRLEKIFYFTISTFFANNSVINAHSGVTRTTTCP